MSNERIYKSFNLFGNEEIYIVENKQKIKPGLFGDYDSFVDKFVPKKTTDDCYTPKDVYDIVVGYVNENFSLAGKKIIRPFYPGGDFENIDYKDECVVIDNPPFSIVTSIARFYIEKEIPFFIFAPHLTLFSSDIECTHIVVGGDIAYENGAVVKTSFLSNMFGDAKVIGDAGLYKKFKQLNDKNKVNLPKYEYPANLLTVSHVQSVVEKGISFRVDKNNTKHCRSLDSQKRQKKAIFGSGFLLSDSAAKQKTEAEKAAAEKAAAENVHKFVWELSEKELNIIKSMDSELENKPQNV